MAEEKTEALSALTALPAIDDPMTPTFGEGYEDDVTEPVAESDSETPSEPSETTPSSEETAQPSTETQEQSEQQTEPEKPKPDPEIGRAASLKGRLQQEAKHLQEEVERLRKEREVLQAAPEIDPDVFAQQARALQDEGYDSVVAVEIAKQRAQQAARDRARQESQGDPQQELLLQLAFNQAILSKQQETPDFRWESEDVQAIHQEFPKADLNTIHRIWKLQQGQHPSDNGQRPPQQTAPQAPPADTARVESPPHTPEVPQQPAPQQEGGYPTEVDNRPVTSIEVRDWETFGNVYRQVPGINSFEDYVRFARGGK